MNRCPRTVYAGMAEAARMGEAVRPDGDARCFTAAFPSHHDAFLFVRRAGGVGPRRTGDYRVWRWTMPDGLTAVLPFESDTVTFVTLPDAESAYYAAGFRMEEA